MASGRIERVKHEAKRRAEEYPPQLPPDLDPRPCAGCGSEGEGREQHVVRWQSFYTPMPVVGLLIGLGGGMMTTRRLGHPTYHWLCKPCRRRVWTQRLKHDVLRGLGLFVGIVGLILTMAAVAGVFTVASPHDRAWLLARSWVPAAALAVAALMLWASRRFPLPGVLDKLDNRPFLYDTCLAVPPERYDELAGDFPDIHGLTDQRA